MPVGEFGGLGWVDLQLKNKALLNKWILRFDNEKDNLWRRLLVNKEGGDHGIEPQMIFGKSKGYAGVNSYRGVFIDELGAIKVLFSKAIEIAYVNTIEVLVIREAFKIFRASRWVRSHALIVESDSSNAVSWFHNPKKAPWKLRRELLILEGIKRRIGECKVNKISRENNSMVDELAKSGVTREEELLFFLRIKGLENKERCVVSNMADV
ncbi:Uncharacterized protein TCM_003565 [Theobroma cacao]|uniref:RNase H type-1 domain-containing protein n=1 Tax=Theobroma cacao TaxID=3641 RepID=A0A061DP64_THECC|nr:Uncharacterized protein TCM_003565 [Theobroma cacao]